MKKEIVKVRIDQDMKEKYKKYTDQLGITMSEDILLYIQRCISGKDYNSVYGHNDRKAQIYYIYNNIYNKLKDNYFDGAAELLAEWSELECLL